VQVETLKEVLIWTQKFHRHLSQCLAHCANENENERARLLLRYLAEHEERLESLIDEIQQTASASALNTWCQEYVDKKPITAHLECQQPFSESNTGEISDVIFKLHNELTELYRFLYAQAGAPSALKLLKQLIELEEHEAMQMAQGTNQLEDL